MTDLTAGRLLESSDNDEWCNYCVPTWLIILPKVFGAISILSSAYLFKIIAAEKRKNAYHRIMINMSFMDILFTAPVHFVGSWMMPAGTAPLSAGNLATCDSQGFIATGGSSVALPLCNAALSTYYNLIVKYGWTDARISKIEKWLHIAPWALGTVTGVIPLAAKLMVPGQWGCWFGNTQYPLGCDSSETCERGWNSAYFFWPILLLICVAPAYVAGSMYVVYNHVRKMEKRIAQYQSTTRLSLNEQRDLERKNTKKSRIVMEQSLLYAAAMFLTLVFAFVAIMLPQFGLPIPLWCSTLFAIFSPLQGSYNLAIHLRRSGKGPRVNIKKGAPAKSWMSSRFRRSSNLAKTDQAKTTLNTGESKIGESKLEVEDEESFHENEPDMGT